MNITLCYFLKVTPKNILKTVTKIFAIEFEIWDFLINLYILLN